jgi:hypothetical protein
VLGSGRVSANDSNLCVAVVSRKISGVGVEHNPLNATVQVVYFSLISDVALIRVLEEELCTCDAVFDVLASDCHSSMGIHCRVS